MVIELEELRKWCEKMEDEFPSLRSKIDDRYQLAKEEYEAGERLSIVVEDCMTDVEILTEPEDNSCFFCNGTGISSIGRVNDDCSYCKGSGEL